MIRLAGISKRYHDGQQDVWALRDLDLWIPKGQVAAVTGKSGSGKSTLLHLIAGLDYPDSGQITVGSVSVHRLNEDQRTAFRLHEIGLVFQFFHLLPGLTAVENVMFPAELAGQTRRAARRRALELLDEVQLSARADAFSDRLSGGEQQRVAIARSLVLLPPVLLADEPTGNLDAETGERVSALLLNLARSHGATVLLATHSVDLARQADRVVEIRAGRIVADSPRTYRQ
jgi:putative ABC transport system ATP-binding protein